MTGHQKLKDGCIRGTFGPWGWGWAVYDKDDHLVCVYPTKTKFLAQKPVPRNIIDRANKDLTEHHG